jgi:hypothetical protein
MFLSSVVLSRGWLSQLRSPAVFLKKGFSSVVLSRGWLSQMRSPAVFLKKGFRHFFTQRPTERRSVTEIFRMYWSHFGCSETHRIISQCKQPYAVNLPTRYTNEVLFSKLILLAFRMDPSITNCKWKWDPFTYYTSIDLKDRSANYWN